VPEEKRVFLSGTPVFFINSYLPLNQVRGGVDSGAIHSFWDHAAYQIREGKNSELAKSWLEALGVSYILIHTDNSKEPFRDFKHPGKFDEFASLLSKENGDLLYKLDSSSIIRIASEDIVNAKPPKNGADLKALKIYLKNIKRKIDFAPIKSNVMEISVDIKKDEVLSLAVSYNSGWRMNSSGIITSDSLGNMVVIPEKEGKQKIRLTYSNSILNYFLPAVFSLIFLLIIIKFEKVYPYLSRLIARFSIGMNENEENY